MLRLLVLVLVLANAGYFAWSQGLLRDWGFAPGQASEPQRMRQQLKPEVVRILPASEARSSDGTVVAGAECLLAGPLDDAQLVPVKQALQAWPAGSWTLEPVAAPAHGQLLTLPAVDERLRPRVEALRPVLNAIKLRPCR